MLRNKNILLLGVQRGIRGWRWNGKDLYAKDWLLYCYNMLQLKEENRSSGVLEAYINQNVTSESHTSTIHSAVAKGRLSFGPSHHSPDSHRRRVIRLHQENRQELPVLGHKVQKEDSRRMYESLIICDESSKEPPVKRVKLSQLITNYSEFYRPSVKKRTETALPHKRTTLDNTKEYVPRKKKKAGYEGQKLRLKQNQNQISRFLSNYERVEMATKLKDVMEELKEEVIRTHSHKFALLATEH